MGLRFPGEICPAPLRMIDSTNGVVLSARAKCIHPSNTADFQGKRGKARLARPLLSELEHEWMRRQLPCAIHRKGKNEHEL